MSASPPPILRARHALTLLCASALGGLLAVALGLPVPFFLGGLAFASLLSTRWSAPRPDPVLRNLGFALMGYGVGVEASSDAFGGSALVLIAGGVATTLVIFACVRAVLGRSAPHWPETSKAYSSIPGSMSAVLAVAADAGSDMQRIGLVHLSRLALLCVVLPWLALGADSVASTVETYAMLATDWALLIAAMSVCLAGGGLAARLRLPAAYLLAGIAISGTLAAIFPLPPLPDIARAASALLIVAFLGPTFARSFSSLSRADIRPAALCAFASLLASALMAFMLMAFVDADPRALLLGLAPGGMEVAVLSAVASGTDAELAVALQLTRYLTALALLTAIARKSRHTKETNT